MGTTPNASPISRAQWLTLTAALLGWMFDGFEMGVFPIVARPALRDLLGGESPEETVRRWNAILAAVFLFGGLRRNDRPRRMRLEHGDVVVWGGPARLRYHGVLALGQGLHALTGHFRFNLTLRRAA